MATTLSTLRSAVRRFLDESTAGTWSNADLNQYINDSELAMWMDMSEIDPSFGLRESTGTLVQAQTDYLYPTDILGRNIRSLYCYTSSTTTWYKVDHASYSEVIEEGTSQRAYPYKYVCMDGFFKIGPPPDASGYTIRIAYTREPTAMTQDSDSMDSDDCFAEAIAIGAAIRALERTGVDTTALQKRQDKAVNQIIGSTQPNEPRSAKCAWEYK